MIPRNPFNWRGPHHGYIGMFLIILGALMHPEQYAVWIRVLFGGVGLLILFDDLIEHTVTKATPLRLFFERIIYPLVKK